MNSQRGSHLNYNDRSVKNIGGHISGNVTTGDNVNNGTPKSEDYSPKHEKPKVFSSFILPAIIISVAMIVAALLALVWPSSPQ